MVTEGSQDNGAERGFENILTREEVLSKIGTYCENPTIKREELDDKNRMYLLEVTGTRKIEKDNVEYIYQRKGTFPNGSDSLVTSIMVVDESGWAENIAEYDSVTRKWVAM